MNAKRLGAIILLIVTGVCGLFAWFSKRDQDEIDEEARLLRPKLDNPNIDDDWLHRQRMAERP